MRKISMLFLMMICLCTFVTAEAATIFDGSATQLRDKMVGIVGNRAYVADLLYDEPFTNSDFCDVGDKAYRFIVGDNRTLEYCTVILFENKERKVFRALIGADMTDKEQTSAQVGVVTRLVMWSIGMNGNEINEISVNMRNKNRRRLPQEDSISVDVKCNSIGRIIRTTTQIKGKFCVGMISAVS
ncbi:MAG: hypothetical protein J6O13_06030 [Selenomonas sp.]|nr:hypothetical protein [Selenomonas sp.]